MQFDHEILRQWKGTHFAVDQLLQKYKNPGTHRLDWNGYGNGNGNGNGNGDELDSESDGIEDWIQCK